MLADQLSKVGRSPRRLLKGKHGAESGGRRDVEAGMVRGETLDKENGELNARFVQPFTGIAIVFTLTRFALFSLCKVTAGRKWNARKVPDQVQAGPL